MFIPDQNNQVRYEFQISLKDVVGPIKTVFRLNKIFASLKLLKVGRR